MSEEQKMKLPVDKILTGILLVAFLGLSFVYAKDKGWIDFNGVSLPKIGGEKKVTLDLYVMSQCPYGVQAEDGVKPVYDKMSDVLAYNINYIADDNGDGTFGSLHGEPEVKGNIVQLCAKKYDQKRYYDMIACQNKDYQNIPDNWEKCAKDAGIEPLNKIKECYEGQEGKTLLSENVKLAKQLSVGGSPTYYFNGEIYQGGRDAITLTRFVCSKINNEHSACKDMPVCATNQDCTSEPTKVGNCINAGAKDAKCEYSDPKKVDMIVLNDKRCVECNVATNISESLKQIFKGLVVKEVDYKDAEGSALYKKMNGAKLPVFLFSENVKEGEGYSDVEQYLAKVDEYYSLAVGSTFDPSKEICDNKIDDNGNRRIDCADADCVNSSICRKEIVGKVDVFVMSDCPYGVQAENSMKEVLNNFGGAINFNINYIASDNGDGTFQSLHGEYEAVEDIRQLCVKKYYPVKLLDYVWCRNEQGVRDGKWEDCANSNSIKTTVIDTCTNGEGKALLSANVKVADGLGISASPTWLINNKYQASGVDAESIKSAICQYNPSLKGCENVLTNNAGSANTAAGCQ